MCTCVWGEKGSRAGVELPLPPSLCWGARTFAKVADADDRNNNSNDDGHKGPAAAAAAAAPAGARLSSRLTDATAACEGGGVGVVGGVADGWGGPENKL